MRDFYVGISDFAYDVIVITETWLNESVYSTELFPDYYSVVRCDRKFSAVNRSRGGGALIAFSPNISFKVIDTSNICMLVPLIDLIVCKCIINDVSIVIVAAYVPPDLTCSDLEQFLNSIELLLLNQCFVILGDFNLPSLTKTTSACKKSNCFKDFINTVDAKQYNLIPNSNNSILDLILSNIESKLTVSRCDNPVVREDHHHPSLCVALEVSFPRHNSRFPTDDNFQYNFRRADYNLLYHDLCAADWSFLNEIDDVDIALDSFYETLYKVCHMQVPPKRSSSSHYPPWFTGEIRQNLKNKDYYRKKWLKTKNLTYQAEYNRIRRIVKLQISEAYDFYVASVESDINADPVHLWKFLHDRRRTTRIPGIVRDGTIDLKDPSAIVDGFARTFSSAYSNGANSRCVETFSNYLSFVIPPVMEEDIIKIMAKFKNKFTAGPDMVPSFMVRDCRFVLAKPLESIINLSIRSGIFPRLWKIARICPIHKKGDKAVLTNYRPISILSNFAKVYEQVLQSVIYNNTRSYFSPHQHGFIRGRSTVTNLATVAQYIGEVLDRRGQVDVIYTDFSHAFDTINHDILIRKIANYGLVLSGLNLLRSYLSDRCCFVSYNGFSSGNFFVNVGVPQGSNLGPLLFNLFINDLLEQVTCPILAYADDLKIYSEIKSLDCVIEMQNNLNKVADWSESNGLILNISKCHVVTYCRNNSVVPSNYLIGNATLERVSSFRDLGVVFDSRFSFAEHIDLVCDQAYKSLGFVLRVSGYFQNEATVKKLFSAYVLSRLEYASLIWYPIYACHSLALDRIHRKFLKYLSYRGLIRRWVHVSSRFCLGMVCFHYRKEEMHGVQVLLWG